ncbi:hypothetical protein EON65_30680 [archaeon]|nr:MAG: hypothetical protein EON65_30680 [archaeon]
MDMDTSMFVHTGMLPDTPMLLARHTSHRGGYVHHVHHRRSHHHEACMSHSHTRDHDVGGMERVG